MTDAELAAIRDSKEATRQDVLALLAEIERLRAATTTLPEYGTGTLDYSEAWVA